jgi:NTE family protein
MQRVVSLLAALLLLAACNGSDEVPPERHPRFDPAVVKPPRVALVLGGGGPRGFAHVGVIKVLEEAGIRPDVIVGSSAGAMVGALYAGGMNAERLEREAMELKLASFFELRTLVNMLSTGSGTQHWVNERVGGRPLQSLPIPLVVTAKRVRDGSLVFFNRGDTGLAVRASSADSTMFQPVRIGDHTYVDGDEMSPVPIRVARALGARVVIAVNVAAHADTTPPGVPREWVDKDARRAKLVSLEAPYADVMLHPDIGYYAGHSADYRKKVIGLAEAYARKRLPEIRAAVAAAPPAQAQNDSTDLMPAGVASR